MKKGKTNKGKSLVRFWLSAATKVDTEVETDNLALRNTLDTSAGASWGVVGLRYR